MEPELDPKQVRRDCQKFLTFNYPRTTRQALSDLVEYVGSDAEMDEFGRGVLHERLENRLTEILGKESAVFMPTGRVSQLCALKVWCESRGNSRLVLHPRCHMEGEYENKAYAQVFQLQSVPVGEGNRPWRPQDFEELTDPVGAISIEIPMMPLGCVLPPWEDLVGISRWARERGIPLHADGVRLWEIGPYYRRPYDEIAGLFDTITVSFHKSLGAMAGGAVAGPADVIRKVRTWQHRVGAAPYRMYPMLIDALRGLDEVLPRMNELYARAQSLAKALSTVPGVRVDPNPPHSNTMRVIIDGEPSRLIPAALRVSRETGLWLVDRQSPSVLTGTAMFPVAVGMATLDVSDAEAVAAMELLSERLRRPEK